MSHMSSRSPTETGRRTALIQAAIKMIGEQGSLDVSVQKIAKQAGMSSALAFHYFGGKDEIVIETMRHLLRELSKQMAAELAKCKSANDRVDAIIRVSFSPEQFKRNTIAAWLVFYLKAYSSPQAARLLTIYKKRLHSNLLVQFSQMMDRQRAVLIAVDLGALIDGLYIRQSLNFDGPSSQHAIQSCQRFVNAALCQAD